MPNFTLRTVNSIFFTETAAIDYPSADDALEHGVRGALKIAVDEIHAGARSSVVELIVEDEAGLQVRRSAVSVSVAPLAVGMVERRAIPEPLNDH